MTAKWGRHNEYEKWNPRVRPARVSQLAYELLEPNFP